MRVVVAGGTGFIGKRIVDSYLADGAEVVVLTRGASEARPDDPPNLLRQKWDGRGPGEWQRHVDGAEVIVNLAGERVAGPGLRYRWTEGRKRLLSSSRVEAGRALVAAVSAAARKPSVFVQASGIDYYPAGEVVETEDSLHGDGFLSRLVADEWEPSTSAVELLGVRRIVLRIAPVLGPGSPVLGPILLQHRFHLGGPIGHGRQWFPWVSLEDLVCALRFLAERGECSGPYNMVSPIILRNAELSAAIGRAMSRPSWLPAPSFILRIAFGEMADTLLYGVRASPKRLLEAGYRFRDPDLSEVLRRMLSN